MYSFNKIKKLLIMKVSANSIKVGNILVYRDELWRVIKSPEHVKPGKGPAYVQLEMKNLKTGNKLNERVSSSDYLEKAQLEQKDFQFLYLEDEKLVLMDTENFEQITLNKDLLGDKFQFLEETPLSVELPQTIIGEVVETDPVIKGSTVTSSYKPAILSNGVKVMVPSYLTVGEKIVVKTEDSSFVERAK
jgi:elongation factor P